MEFTKAIVLSENELKSVAHSLFYYLEERYGKSVKDALNEGKISLTKLKNDLEREFLFLLESENVDMIVVLFEGVYLAFDHRKALDFADVLIKYYGLFE